MKKTTFKLLICPDCKKSVLKLQIDKEQGEHIINGTITCINCNEKYLIRNGVAALLPKELGKLVKKTKQSFSSQWERQKQQGKSYNDLKTWGFSLNERKKLFLNQIAINQVKLKNKLILDAGCGNGTVSLAMASYNMDVIAMDISDSVFYFNHLITNPNIDLIQGSVLDPPFKDGIFDFIYSSGVLHHTPRPRDAFIQLTNKLKKGGRFWVWLYVKISLQKTRNWIYENKLKLYLYEFLNKIISRLPKILQDLVLLSFIPVFILKQEIEILLRLKKFGDDPYRMKKENWQDKLVILYDNFAHPYNFRYDPKHIINNWVSKLGYKNVKLNYTLEKGGFGIYGDKS